MVVCPVMKEREREEKFDIKPFADAATSVLMFVNDLCHVVLMKHGVVYGTTNNITKQPQGWPTVDYMIRAPFILEVDMGLIMRSVRAGF
jgi:hypothetical protein